MARSQGGGARKPASKFPQLRKQMQKNAVVRGLHKNPAPTKSPRSTGKKNP